MNDFTKALSTLEFYKITDMLADLAATEGAKSLARALTPSGDPAKVARLLQQTTDAKAMTASNGSPSFGGVVDVTAAAERAAKGAVLTTRELIDVADLLHVVSRLAAYAGEKGSTAGSLTEEKFPFIQDIKDFFFPCHGWASSSMYFFLYAHSLHLNAFSRFTMSQWSTSAL